jgi:hypothetical protein
MAPILRRKFLIRQRDYDRPKAKKIFPGKKVTSSRNKREPDRIVAVESAISKLQNL